MVHLSDDSYLTMNLPHFKKPYQPFIHYVCLGMMCVAFLSIPAKTVLAQDQDASDQTVAQMSYEDRASLLRAARSFVHNIKTKFERVDRELNPPDPLAGLQDGEVLIFTFRVLDGSKKIPIAGEAFAEKQGNALYMSFRDFINVMYFPIQFDPEAKVAEGWFVREAHDFAMNWAARSVTSKDQQFQIPDAVIEQPDDLYIPLSVLESWFDLSLKPQVENLLIDIGSEDRLPLLDRLQRRDRDIGNRLISEPELPRLDDPYLMAEVPAVDVTVASRYRRPPSTIPNGKSERIETATLQAAGDIAGHTGELFVSADSEDQVRNVRFTLSKDEEDPTLLGPLKARRYEVGDVITTNMPLFSSGGQELGARVTNRKTGGSTSFTQTNFFGDLPQDWDVELYRNNQLIEFVTVGPDGRYEFRDVALFEGDNDFRFVFYGPQGEIREELKSIPVDLAELQEGGIYDFSITSQDTQTYENPETERDETGDLSFTATYERPLGDGFVGIAGIKQRSYGEDQKTQFLAGVTKNFDGTLVNANLGVDQSGEGALETTIRRKFGEHDLRTNSMFATDNFSPNEDSDDPTVLEQGFNLRGPLFEWDRTRVDYAFRGNYQESASGADRLDLSHNLNANFNPLRVNHTLDYRRQPEAADDERLSSTLAVSGATLGTNWRAIANYDYKPDSKLDSTQFQLSRRVFPGVRAGYELEYRPDPSYTKNTLDATWNTEDFSITPKISLDSEDELQATVTTRFGLVRDPRSGTIDMTRQRNAASGTVSAFVFLDENGDLEFNEGEKGLQDVRIDSIQTRRYAITDEDGYALLSGLREFLATDIKVDQSSLEDPFWIAGKPGNSIRPRPGHNVSMDFPIHISGEMDGTVWAIKRGAREGVRNLTLILYDLDGRIVQTTQTAYDGFYLFSLIPPGEYYLAFEKADIETLDLVAPPPEKIQIGYEGTIIYGKDFMLDSADQGGASFSIVSGYEDMARRHAHLSLPVLGERTVVLNLGEYRSNLLMATTWYEMRTRMAGLFGREYALVKPSQSLPDIKTNKHTLRVHMPGMSIERAYQACRSLTARGFACDVEFLPKGYDPQNI